MTLRLPCGRDKINTGRVARFADAASLCHFASEHLNMDSSNGQH